MDERTPTATALAGARSLLSSVDHMGRKRLDAEHGSNHHADDYHAVIAFVENHPGLTRAKAKK